VFVVTETPCQFLKRGLDQSRIAHRKSGRFPLTVIKEGKLIAIKGNRRCLMNTGVERRQHDQILSSACIT
jgi:hypothetical protein